MIRSRSGVSGSRRISWIISILLGLALSDNTSAQDGTGPCFLEPRYGFLEISKEIDDWKDLQGNTASSIDLDHYFKIATTDSAVTLSRKAHLLALMATHAYMSADAERLKILVSKLSDFFNSRNRDDLAWFLDNNIDVDNDEVWVLTGIQLAKNLTRLWELTGDRRYIDASIGLARETFSLLAGNRDPYLDRIYVLDADYSYREVLNSSIGRQFALATSILGQLEEDESYIDEAKSLYLKYWAPYERFYIESAINFPEVEKDTFPYFINHTMTHASYLAELGLIELRRASINGQLDAVEEAISKFEDAIGLIGEACMGVLYRSEVRYLLARSLQEKWKITARTVGQDEARKYPHTNLLKKSITSLRAALRDRRFEEGPLMWARSARALSEVLQTATDTPLPRNFANGFEIQATTLLDMSEDVLGSTNIPTLGIITTEYGMRGQ